MKHLIKSGFAETQQFFGSNPNVILTRTHAANTQSLLREANAERWRFIFPYEFGTLHVLDLKL